MPSKPTVRTFHGVLTLTRAAVAQEFHCARCDADKKAKATAQWQKLDGTTVTICNGCYGNFLA